MIVIDKKKIILKYFLHYSFAKERMEQFSMMTFRVGARDY